MEDERQGSAAGGDCLCGSSLPTGGAVVDERGGVVDQGKDKRAQGHAVRPVASIGAGVMEEIAVPVWDGGREERGGEEAGHETRHVERAGEVFAKHACSGSRTLFKHVVGGGVGCNGNAFLREHLCVVRRGSRIDAQIFDE